MVGQRIAPVPEGTLRSAHPRGAMSDRSWPLPDVDQRDGMPNVPAYGAVDDDLSRRTRENTQPNQASKESLARIWSMTGQTIGVHAAAGTIAADASETENMLPSFAHLSVCPVSVCSFLPSELHRHAVVSAEAVARLTDPSSVLCSIASGCHATPARDDQRCTASQSDTVVSSSEREPTTGCCITYSSSAHRPIAAACKA